MTAAHIPVVLLTGFLGSGKTSLLNRLLAQPGMADTLVIINEYGATSLDHLLVTHPVEQQVVELASGCVCCTLRGDLAQTLRDAHWRFARAGRRQFERVMIETTGLADPAPVLRTLVSDKRIAARYRLASTLTVVDATAAADTLVTRPEAQRQIACADRLLISKSDLVTPDTVAALQAALARINPFAPQIDLRVTEADAALLQPVAAGTPRYRPAAAATTPHAVRADCFTLDSPIPVARLDAWLTDWPVIAGPGLLRMKALLDIEGLRAPRVVHGVQHTLHPPAPLAGWPQGAQGSTVVFITQGISGDALRAHMGTLGVTRCAD